MKDCPQKKTESCGSRLKRKNPETKQVSTEEATATKVEGEVASPLDYLGSSCSEDESGVRAVRIKDTGSKAQHARVVINGVPTQGVIDSGADITIVGGELFKQIATAAKLKKKDFRRADRTTRTSDLELHGCMDLDTTFEGKTLTTPVYIKMDAPTQLLLSEGVCRQLGILSYHPSIPVSAELAVVLKTPNSGTRRQKRLLSQRAYQW